MLITSASALKIVETGLRHASLILSNTRMRKKALHVVHRGCLILEIFIPKFLKCGNALWIWYSQWTISLIKVPYLRILPLLNVVNINNLFLKITAYFGGWFWKVFQSSSPKFHLYIWDTGTRPQLQQPNDFNIDSCLV